VEFIYRAFIRPRQTAWRHLSWAGAQRDPARQWLPGYNAGMLSTSSAQRRCKMSISEGKYRFGVLDAVRGGRTLTRPSKGGTRDEKDC
jgi:hypothetical protein